MTITHTPTNQQMIERLQGNLAAVLAEALRRGFYGTAAVELAVQDGTIQSIRRRVERVDKM